MGGFTQTKYVSHEEYRAARDALTKFREYMASVKVLSRDAQIENNFLSEIGPTLLLPGDSKSAPPTRDSHGTGAIVQLLQKMKEGAGDSRDILVEILESLPLQDHDREVLVDAFAALPFNDLEKAVLELAATFSES